MFIYNNERARAHLVDLNAPVSLRHGYDTIAKLGSCSETLWSYQLRRFRRQPTVPTRRDAFVGGHAVLAVGYRHATRQFVFRNSWGRGWGDHGYGYLPYEFVASAALTWDFWTLRRVS